MTEQPIVTLGEIAKFLRVSEDKARAIIKSCRVPLIHHYKPLLAVFPSDLQKYLKQKNNSSYHETEPEL